MKWENLKQLKKGDKIKYRSLNRHNTTIKNGIIKDIFNCGSIKNGKCYSQVTGHFNKRCIGDIKIIGCKRNNLARCGAENGWSLIDPEIEDFIKEKDFMI